MASARVSESPRPGEAALDAVYERLASSNPFMPVTGFVDHSTMAAEALVALGQGEHVEAWGSRARARAPIPVGTGMDLATNWQNALGRRQHLGDWIALFERELQDAPFTKVLAKWVPRLAHDPGALLFHGLIRTGHAARSLDHSDSAPRRTELANALALWAVGVRQVPADERAADLDVQSTLALARKGAVAFVRSPNIRDLHFVTGPMAAALLEPHIGEEGREALLRGLNRTHANIGSREQPRPSAETTQLPDAARLRALAEPGADVHAIKLTEAALRAYRSTSDPIFLEAVAAV